MSLDSLDLEPDPRASNNHVFPNIGWLFCKRNVSGQSRKAIPLFTTKYLTLSCPTLLKFYEQSQIMYHITIFQRTLQRKALSLPPISQPLSLPSPTDPTGPGATHVLQGVTSGGDGFLHPLRCLARRRQRTAAAAGATAVGPLSWAFHVFRGIRRQGKSSIKPVIVKGNLLWNQWNLLEITEFWAWLGYKLVI